MLLQVIITVVDMLAEAFTAFCKMHSTVFICLKQVLIQVHWQVTAQTQQVKLQLPSDATSCLCYALSADSCTTVLQIDETRQLSYLGVVSLQVLTNEAHMKRPLQLEIAALSTHNGELSVKHEDLRQANGALTSSNVSLKKANGALTSDYESLQKACGDLHGWNQALAKKNRGLKAKLAAAEQTQGTLFAHVLAEITVGYPLH